MSGGELLLDSNAVIAWTEEEESVAKVLGKWIEPRIPTFVAGELYFGALNSARSAQNLETLRRTLEYFPILLPDELTHSHYAEVRMQLQRRGRPIPPNDLWIAALAVQHRWPLLTRDAHFRHVDGLEVIGW